VAGKKNTKWTVAKVAGACIVGAVGAIATKELVKGSGMGAVIIAAIVSPGLHEAADAPVSTWVYQQI
jgi:hypothetical protein